MTMAVTLPMALAAAGASAVQEIAYLLLLLRLETVIERGEGGDHLGAGGFHGIGLAVGQGLGGLGIETRAGDQCLKFRTRAGGWPLALLAAPGAPIMA